MEAVTKEITFEKYSNYKDSGTDWLGDIPIKWNLLRMKYLFRDISIKNKPKEELLSVTQDKGVVPRTWVENRMVMPSGALESFKFIEEGDFAISLRSFEGGLEYCYHDGIISPAYTVLKALKDIDSGFYKYLFKSKSFISELQTSVVGIRQGKNISYPELSYSLMPIPPKKEQTAIARFLDEKTAKIDEAIAIKQKQIELLKERRQILIYKAVTQGLNPDAPLKPSGVDWIGEIPEHWEVKKIKYVTSKIGSGITPSGGATTYIDDGIPLLRSQNIHFGRIDFNDVAYISESTHKSMSNSQVEKGDVLLNITGGSLGRCHYVIDDKEMNVNQHVCILRPTKDIQTIYLNGLIASKVGQGQIWFYQQGGGREGLNFQAIKNFLVPLPPVSEQIDISEKVDEISTVIFKAVLETELQIKKLKEYKTTLINSAVTGKIKVG